MAKFLEKAFGFDPQQHNVRTEILAGLTTFLTMAYILAVNPGIFSALPGMPAGSVFTATALAAIVGTLVMALYAKKPFALAPGMGLNAFFVFTVCLGMGHSWQFALTAVLLEGIIFIILTVTKVRTWLINAIPGTLKKAIGAGIGLFIAFIGMQNAGIIVNNDATLVSLGSITEGKALVGLIGLFITAGLVMAKVRGGILWGILLTVAVWGFHSSGCPDVERKISGSTYLRNPQFVEGADDAGSALEGRIDNGVKAVIFDTDAFSYDAILYWMYSRAQEGRRYTMGLYSAKTGKLITEDEVI